MGKIMLSRNYAAVASGLAATPADTSTFLLYVYETIILTNFYKIYLYYNYQLFSPPNH